MKLHGIGKGAVIDQDFAGKQVEEIEMKVKEIFHQYGIAKDTFTIRTKRGPCKCR